MRASMDKDRSWLLPDHFDRERMLDMDRRLGSPRLITLGVLALALLAAGPWIGYWTLLPLVAAGLLFKIAGDRIGGRTTSERAIFAAWIGSQVLIAASVLLAGAEGLPALAWFAIPVVTLSARFSYRGIALGVTVTLVLLLAVAFISDARGVLDTPTTLLAPTALVIAVAVLSSALMRSDVEHRSASVIDPLTGMLNRKALAGRVEELRQQADVAGAAVGLIAIDIDHFKRVNDTIGHAAGDAVLRDIAYLIRKRMRAFELAYRIGGEEFLVLLPGADVGDAARLAGEVGASVRSARFVDDLAITISCGVAASSPGAELDFEVLMAAADSALYEAKAAGRDRVVRTDKRGGGDPAVPLRA